MILSETLNVVKSNETGIEKVMFVHVLNNFDKLFKKVFVL